MSAWRPLPENCEILLRNDLFTRKIGNNYYYYNFRAHSIHVSILMITGVFNVHAHNNYHQLSLNSGIIYSEPRAQHGIQSNSRHELDAD